MKTFLTIVLALVILTQVNSQFRSAFLRDLFNEESSESTPTPSTVITPSTVTTSTVTT